MDGHGRSLSLSGGPVASYSATVPVRFLWVYVLPTLSQDPRIGSELGGYRIESLIGRGGMGVVYLAEDVTLGRKVAIKLLAPELAEDERFRERFLREWRLAASLEHPNIITIYEARQADGSLYLAMRYVEGTDLRAVIDESGPLPVERAISIVAQVASALDAAHEKGLIHRDVKPGNIPHHAGVRARASRSRVPLGLRPDETGHLRLGHDRHGPVRRDPRLCGARAVRREVP
jgi:hypothetical protein